MFITNSIIVNNDVSFKHYRVTKATIRWGDKAQTRCLDPTSQVCV